MKLSGGMLAFLSAILMGITMALIEPISKIAGPLQLIVISQLVAALIMLVSGKVNVNELMGKSKYQLVKLGVLRDFFARALLVYGFMYSNTIRGTFVTRLEPVFVAIMAWLFLKNKLKKRDIGLIGLVVVGSIILSTNGDFSSFGEMQIGDGMIALSVFLFAYSYIIVKNIKKTETTTMTFAGNVYGGLLALVVAVVVGTDFFVSLEGLGLILTYAVLFNIVAMKLFYDALEKIEAWKVGTILSFMSVVAAGIAFVFYGQTLTTLQIGGASIVLIASALVTYYSRK
jgi:drug/metabolite transporter (DMT)-like permease